MLIIAGLATAGSDDPPNILVSNNAALIAVRTDADVAYLSSLQASPFVRDIWQRRLGVSEIELLDAGLSCDVLGCTGEVYGQVIAIVENALGFAEECRRADILISSEPIPRACTGPTVTIGRFDVWRSGAHAVWISDGEKSFRVWRARERDPGRPWMRATQLPVNSRG